MSDNFSQSTVSSICFNRNDFNLYAFLLFCVIMYLCFILKKCKETFIETTSDIANSGLKREQLLERLEILQDKLFFFIAFLIRERVTSSKTFCAEAAIFSGNSSRKLARKTSRR